MESSLSVGQLDVPARGRSTSDAHGTSGSAVMVSNERPTAAMVAGEKRASVSIHFEGSIIRETGIVDVLLRQDLRITQSRLERYA